jgi:hypothetical protein
MDRPFRVLTGIWFHLINRHQKASKTHIMNPKNTTSQRRLTARFPYVSIHCKGTFQKVEDHDYHLQDMHCWIPRDATRSKAGLKSALPQAEEEEELAEESIEKPCKRTKQSAAAVWCPDSVQGRDEPSSPGSRGWHQGTCPR